MSEFGDKKLVDSIPHPVHVPPAEPPGGPSVPDHETTAEQSREARESREAADVQASIREKMVEIGRGNQQAGRQGD